jgi:hypothetical protein
MCPGHFGPDASPTEQASMSESSSPLRIPDPSSADPALTDRVLARVRNAGLAVDRRARATRPKLQRRRIASSSLAAAGTRTPEELREVRALRRVFLELGESYRQYRRRTGTEMSERVREAAHRFRRELDVTSLVAVAATLDELGALSW